MKLIRKLLSLFSRKEKWYIFYLLILMISGAMLDAVSIGLILPVIAAIGSPEVLLRFSPLRPYAGYLESLDHITIVLGSFLILSVLYIIKNLFLAFIVHVQCKFIYRKQAATAIALFEVYMRSPYIFHLARNSTELLLNVNSRVPDVLSSLLLIFGIIIEVFVVAMIFLLLVYVDWVSALGASILLGSSVYAFQRFTKQKVIDYSEVMQRHSCRMAQLVHESFGAVKVVKLLGRESFFVRNYAKETAGFMNAYAYRQLVGQLPRYFIESCTIVGMTLIVCFYVWQGKNIQDVLPILALFGTAAFRLMPSLSKIVSNIAAIRFVGPQLEIIHNDIVQLSGSNFLQKYASDDRDKLPREGEPSLAFQRQIELRDIKYAYPGTDDLVLGGVNLTITRGSSVALVGQSGAGKSTTVDLIMGLLEPLSGDLLVDDVEVKAALRLWQDKIGYVPQDIYLCDDTIRSNIAFGILTAEIKDERVWEVLRIAKVADFVASLPAQLDTVVGERGVRLSGGQKQRIGIARALYHDPEVLVMDEATSSLDNETEIAIADSIDALTGDKTIIIIAHRTATRERCQYVYTLENGVVVRPS